MKKVIRCYGSLREKYGSWRSRRDLNSQEKPAWRAGAIPLGDYSIRDGEILTKPFTRTLPSHSPRYSKPFLNLLTGTMIRSLVLYEIATFKTNEFHHYPYNFNSWERPSFAVIA